MAKTKQQGGPIWMDGQFVDFDKAVIHPLSSSVQYGMGVFEGIRSYATKKGTAIFRLDDHVQRLFDSAHAVGIVMPYTRAIVKKAIIDTVKKSKVESTYIRPMVYLGHEYLGLHAQNLSTHLLIATWDMGKYLGPSAGIRVCTSSYSRIHPSSVLTKAKVCGHYVNSILAYHEARQSGYDEAIMLDSQGRVAETSSSSIFMVKKGVVYTPTDVSILLSITRDTVLHICRDLKLEVVVKDLTRDEFYTADEMFLTGTAAEIKSIAEYDAHQIGKGGSGPTTTAIRQVFDKIVSGASTKYAKWLTKV